MTDRELLQQVLDTLRHLCLHSRAVQGYDGEQVQTGIDALKARLAQPESAECDGGQCGIGGYCKQCPKTQPEQEPVAWKMKGVPAFATSRPNDTDSIKWDALYTAPPQREWQGLTDDEIGAMEKEYLFGGKEFDDEIGYWAVYRAIEAKLREKNG